MEPIAPPTQPCTSLWKPSSTDVKVVYVTPEFRTSASTSQAADNRSRRPVDRQEALGPDRAHTSVLITLLLSRDRKRGTPADCDSVSRVWTLHAARLGRHAVCIPNAWRAMMQEIKRYQLYRVRSNHPRGLVERLLRWLRRRRTQPPPFTSR
jgi:hypothetical protein